MLKINKHGVLLEKTAFEFECCAVLNPAILKMGDQISMFYRAVGKDNISSIGFAQLSDPLTIGHRRTHPVLLPHFEYESHGVEDPRLVLLDGLFLLTYTAYNGVNALGAYACSKDLVHFEKKGILVPQISFQEFSQLAGSKVALHEKYTRFNSRERLTQLRNSKVLLWDKNLVFFSKRINGKIFFLHRIKPEIQITSVYELADLTEEFWENYFLHFHEHILMQPQFAHEVSYIGAGCPPIETKDGWLLIYHGVYDTTSGYVYCVCAALLALHNPTKVIARLPYPLFKPEEIWEKKGTVSNVCFPTGALVADDTLYIYYGAADERIASASLCLSQLLLELLNYGISTNQTES
jgi:beta-1,2-mannobiose phosphorylase / 1,2-beta-oligomannan phosphorylase